MKMTLVLLLCVFASWEEIHGLKRRSWSWKNRLNGRFKGDLLALERITEYQPETRQSNELVEERQIEVDNHQPPSSMEESRMLHNLGRFKTTETSKPRTLLLGLFSLLGFDFLVNFLLNSLTISTTSTTTTTFSSTYTVGTVLTCYTSTMFKSTTGCQNRRRRSIQNWFLAGNQDISPSQIERMETSASVEEIEPQTGRAAALFSSFNDLSDNSLNMPEPSFGFPIRKNSRILTETEYVSTFTSTSYAFYTTTSTKIISNLASSTALSCLPSGFTLC